MNSDHLDIPSDQTQMKSEALDQPAGLPLFHLNIETEH
jgi:hypothetical protein